MTVLLQRIQNGGSSGIQILELSQPVADGCDHNLIEASSSLFAVSGDKGNTGILCQKQGNGLNLLNCQVQFVGNQ
jgi:hypothetical protein